jgi:hypothetical protein
MSHSSGSGTHRQLESLFGRLDIQFPSEDGPMVWWQGSKCRRRVPTCVERRSTCCKRSMAAKGIRSTGCLWAFVFNVKGGIGDMSSPDAAPMAAFVQGRPARRAVLQVRLQRQGPWASCARRRVWRPAAGVDARPTYRFNISSIHGGVASISRPSSGSSCSIPSFISHATWR